MSFSPFPKRYALSTLLLASVSTFAVGIPHLHAQEQSQDQSSAEDNSKTDVYFDKPYDTTVYDIIDEYKTEEAAMSEEEFSVFLVDKLKKNIGLSAEKAVEDAEAMILRKRPVKEGFYAMLTIDDDEEEFTFYRRTNNKWERDDTMKSIYVENSQAFCNIQKDCLEVNNICSTNDLAETEIKKNAISGKTKAGNLQAKRFTF